METLLSHLTQALAGKVFHDGSEEYAESLSTYFSAQESGIKPLLILRPHDAKDVAAAVSVLVQANKQAGSTQFAIRSGGHASFSGSANAADGVTIDLRNLNSVEVDEESYKIAIGAGACWGDVYLTLDPLGLTVPGGRHSQVGVGGLTLGGGMSHFSARVGFVCDNVLEYEIVLASGDIIRATKDDPNYSDLFQALRGGSNNFGVVTRLVFCALRQEQMWGGTLIHPLETKDTQMQIFHDFAANPSYDPNASLIQSFGMSAEKGSGVVNSIVYTTTPAEGVPAAIKPFTSIQPVYTNTLREVSLKELTKEQDAFNENGLHQLVTSTTFYLSLSLLHQTYNLWHTSCANVRNSAGIVWSMSLHPITPTVISRSPFLQSAVPTLSLHPAKTIIIAQLSGTWRDATDSSTIETTGVQLIADIEAAARNESLQTGYIYLNYAHPGQNVFGDGEWREELRKVSRKYDPEGVFQACVPGGFKLF